ncbi:hypothetical protein Cabys_1895 [Caldithrix abyssi DSM 13497]|uniref:Uncharacterized protein n=1 Tax=Caldithrix abyssi DSM 13497 TaxID=880073 RepID=A0A1J1C8C6_CALAY|nr:hypothetical protein Cabys_1895 [Caldithrix abyssi DSM 13497]
MRLQKQKWGNGIVRLFKAAKRSSLSVALNATFFKLIAQCE